MVIRFCTLGDAVPSGGSGSFRARFCSNTKTNAPEPYGSGRSLDSGRVGCG